MKKINLLIMLLMSNALLCTSLRASDDYSYPELTQIYNDKEVQITSFSKYEKNRILSKFSSEKDNNKIKKIFIVNLHTFLNKKDKHCELSYIASLSKDYNKVNLNSSLNDLVDIFKLLRVTNVIDDVYYDILENLAKDHYAMKDIELSKAPVKNSFKDYDKTAKDYNLKELFSSFKKYPDEVNSCAYLDFIRLRENVGGDKDSLKDKNKKTKDLMYLAYSKNLITVESYNKLNFLLKDSTIDKRSTWLNAYFRIIFSAKNKMIPFKRTYKIINLDDESTFSTERLKRFSKLTRRKLLFQKYDENQIILLAQVMKKASQRMGVDPDTKTHTPYLVMEYDVENKSGERENLVEKIELDTQSQFNLARRLLRKDLLALQMMKSFQKLKITYEDLVMASLETGYISLDDIAYVVKYDDLWNPFVSKTERMMNMSFRIAGYSTFLLPPPFNVVAALSLSIVEGIVDNRNINGASNDNANTFIE